MLKQSDSGKIHNISSFRKAREALDDQNTVSRSSPTDCDPEGAAASLSKIRKSRRLPLQTNHVIKESAEKKSCLIVLVSHLMNLINSSSSSFLPPSREISRRFKVGLYTVSKAVRQLQRQGLVEVAQGKRVRILKIKGKEQGSIIDAESAAAILKNRIKNDISRGIYQCGDKMPKFAYFAITMHLANDTVSEAFKMLRDDNLIHKVGQRWIVGALKAADKHIISRSDEQSSPVILVLVMDISAWENIIIDEFLSSYTNTFFMEVEKFDISFRVVQQKSFCVMADRRYPKGRQEISDIIRQLGNRYAGALVLINHQELGLLKEWIIWLCGFKKPVLWFDIDNTSPQFDRRNVKMPNYYRCFMNEKKAVAAALDALKRWGHKVIGIPGAQRPHGPPGWLLQRIGLIFESASAMRPKLDIRLEDKEPNPWDDWETIISEIEVLKRIETISEGLKLEHPGDSQREINLLLQNTTAKKAPAFVRLLTQPGLTALLAPNQWIGLNCWHWLISAGVEIPKNLSFVAFDNFPRYRHLPISTIDFGFSLLAYKSAHIFIGDIPINADRYGNIPSEPRLIDRGTLAPPRPNASEPLSIGS